MAIISKQLNGGSTAPTLKLEITPQKYDIENNQTPVDYKFIIERPSTINSSNTKAYTIKIGSKVFTDTALIGGVGTKTITSGTVYVEHSADGSKVINCSFSMAVEITWSGVYNGTVSNSDNVTLETIPRATQPTAPTSANLGDAITIAMPRASSVFTHNLKGTIGNYSFNIAKDVGVSYKWTIPLSLANYIDTTKAKCKITCTTYSIDDKVGTKSLDIALNVPSNVIPTINSITTLETNEKVPSGKIVQKQSLLDVSIGASGTYGSEIVNVISKFDGVTYKGTSFSLPIKKSGDISLYTSVTDTRGRKASKTTTFSILPYSQPKISLFKVDRCDANGNIKHDGSYAKISFDYSINEVDNMNEKSVKIEYKNDGNYITLFTYDSYALLDTEITSAIFDINKSYVFRMTVSDTYSTVTAFAEIGTAKVIWNAHPSGNGINFGGIAEEENVAKFMWNIKNVSDTEWIDIPLTSTFKAYDTEQTPQYRVRLGVVEIMGAISPLNAFTSNATRVTFGNIPKQYAPNKSIYILCQGSGKNTWLLTVSNTGELQISRYGSTTYADVETNAWLSFHATYTID